MADQETRPMSKPAQIAIVVVLGAAAFFAFRTFGKKTRPCTVSELSQTNDICILTGAVVAQDKVQKDLNALQIGDARLDVVTFRDETGSTDVYFDPQKLALQPGPAVRVKGRVTEQRGGNANTASGVKRFVAEGLE
jgi:hypothetical protein